MVSYEPELHPGANVMVKDPKASVKVFTTGSITVTGCPRILFNNCKNIELNICRSNSN